VGEFKNKMGMYFQKKLKYKNIKVEIDGIKFDSKKEANKYQELMMLQKAGVISNLQRQVKFEVCPKSATERASFYVADFVYTQADGKKIIMDVKSEITRKLAVYILKRKLVKNLYKDYIFLES